MPLFFKQAHNTHDDETGGNTFLRLSPDPLSSAPLSSADSKLVPRPRGVGGASRMPICRDAGMR